jgi:hypothetical protein
VPELTTEEQERIARMDKSNARYEVKCCERKVENILQRLYEVQDAVHLQTGINLNWAIRHAQLLAGYLDGLRQRIESLPDEE